MEVAKLIEMTMPSTTNTTHSKTLSCEEFKARREAKLQKAIEEDRKALKQGLVDKLKAERGIRTIERTFDRFDERRQPKAFKACNEYQPQTGNGLLLIGGYGTGKTHLASAICNRLLDNGVPALYNTWAGHLQRLKDEFETGERRYLALMKKVDLLVIDDLGKEKMTDWNYEILFEAINYRYEHKKPVVITTNITAKEFEYRCPAVFSRLCETCSLVVMTGKDYRKE